MNIMVLLSVAEKNAIIQNARERNNAHDPSASRRMSEVFDDDELDIIGRSVKLPRPITAAPSMTAKSAPAVTLA